MTLALIVVALVLFVAVTLVGRLFWPAADSEPGPDDNWEQRNEERMPSLETAPEAGHTEVDAAVAAQELGVD
ncbi:MAG TPA: hypothetical protein VFW39_08560 [Sphingomicrobium sp.]|nr:hypothetical protein [Sphingomicrobium sp.]